MRRSIACSASFVLAVAVTGTFAFAGCEPSSSNGGSPTPTPTPDASFEGGPAGGDPADPTPDELSARGTCPAATGAGTEHKGTISADETWTAAGNPHKVPSSLEILAKVTLEPCVLVQVEKGTRILVGSTSAAGSLVGHGTAQISGGTRDVRPINIDAVDKAAPWGQLVIEPKGTLDLSIAAIQSSGAFDSGDRGALVVHGVAGGTVDGDITRSAKVDRVLVEKSAAYGVNLEAWGTFAAGSDKLWIRGSGSVDFPSAIRMEPGIAGTLPATITATGNVKDEILLQTSKTFMHDDTLVARGIPYRQKGALFVAPSKDGAGVKLTIEAGVTLGFESNAGSGLIIGSSDVRQGTLEAIGTAAAPIVFTSALPTKAPGDWSNINFRYAPKAGNRISYGRVEFAGGTSGTSSYGCGPGSNDSAIIIQGNGPAPNGPSSVFIDHTTFENIGGTTVIVSGWEDDTGPNFTGDNTFGAGTPSCKVSRPRRTGAGDVCDGGRTTCF